MSSADGSKGGWSAATLATLTTVCVAVLVGGLALLARHAGAGQAGPLVGAGVLGGAVVLARCATRRAEPRPVRVRVDRRPRR